MARKHVYKILGTTPYQVLGITPDTTQGEAKLFFRRLAMKYHPDRNSGDTEAAARFKEASEAWDELQDILPKSAVPFPDIDFDDPDFEDAIAQWMLDMDAASPQAAVQEEASAPTQAPAQRTWSTVASEAAGAALATASSGPVKDWRTLSLNWGKAGYGLEKINAEEAVLLLGFYNAFAALKVVQQSSPEFCLYDAIVSRAKKATSGALVIIGAEVVDSAACLQALRYPLASINAARQNVARIAPHVRYNNVPVNSQKLELDLVFLEDYIKTQLVPKLAKRRSEGSGGTKIVRY